MSRTHELQAYAKKAVRLNNPITTQEMIGGFTWSGSSAVMGERVIVVHPDAPSLNKAADDFSLPCEQDEKDNEMDMNILYVAGAALALYLLVYRQ